jgi:hypothetical protein
MPRAQQQALSIDWQQGDFLIADLSDADIIFINATSFIGDT